MSISCFDKATVFFNLHVLDKQSTIFSKKVGAFLSGFANVAEKSYGVPGW
jgi:hypothetical protein